MNGEHERILEEVLITRVTDGEASARDWAEVERLAERDPAMWRRLAEAQRAHAILSRAVEDSIAASELVELPAGEPTGVLATIGRVREYGGWALAAVLAIAFIGVRLGGVPGGGQPGAGGVFQGGLTPVSMTPEHAWANYIDAGTRSGQVLGEMPSVLVEARPLGGDGTQYEVIVLKRVFAKEIVTDPTVFGVQRDDVGRPVLVPEQRGFPASGEQPL